LRTGAPVTSAPDESFTVPRLVPVTDWASAGCGDINSRPARTGTTSPSSLAADRNLFIWRPPRATAGQGAARSRPRSRRTTCSVVAVSSCEASDLTRSGSTQRVFGDRFFATKVARTYLSRAEAVKIFRI